MVSSLMRQTLISSRYPFRVWDDYQFIRKGIRGSGGGPGRPDVPVFPGRPVNVTPPVISGTAQVSQTLSSTTGSWTGEAPLVMSYQWKRGSINVGTNSSSYLLVIGDLGAFMRCEVTATNSLSSASALSNQLGPVIAAPAATAPVNTVLPDVSGAETEGLPLDCTTGTWTGTAPITYEYQWYQVELIEVPAPPVAGAPAPFITGSTSRGSTLHATTGTWTGFPTPTYSYQWTRLPSTPIGTNSSNYVTVVGDIGFSITCTVTATNASGTASMAAMNTKGPITEPVPGASLTTDEGEDLTTDEGEVLTTDA